MKKAGSLVILLVFFTACMETPGGGEGMVREEIVPPTEDYSAYEEEYRRMAEEIGESFTDGETDGKIAVVRLCGIIDVEDVLPLTRILRGMEEDVQGLILWIDSPGGGVSAVTQITYEILRFKEKKPIVAYIGGYGASGAYYISSVCDAIVAREDAAVGSLGVIYVHVNASEHYRQYGFTFEVIKTGVHKDAGADWRSLTDAERAGIRASVSDAFNRFVYTVLMGRELSYDDLQGYIDGSMWDATEAADAGLIDRVGNFDTAVDEIATLSGLSTPELVFLQDEEFGEPDDLSGYWEALRYQLPSTIIERE